MGIGNLKTEDDLARFIEQRANVAQSVRNAVQVALVGRIVPTGATVWGPYSVAPDGWVFVDGASYLRDDLPDLFDLLGTTFGSVDADHFNVPDAGGRVLVSIGSHGDVDALGDNDGLALGSRTPIHTHPDPHTHPVDIESQDQHSVFLSPLKVPAYTAGSFEEVAPWSHKHDVVGDTGDRSDAIDAAAVPFLTLACVMKT